MTSGKIPRNLLTVDRLSIIIVYMNATTTTDAATITVSLTEGRKTIARLVLNTETYEAFWNVPVVGGAGTLVEWIEATPGHSQDLDQIADDNAAFQTAWAKATENV